MLCKIPWLLHQIALQFEVCTRETDEPESPQLSVCVSFIYVYFMQETLLSVLWKLSISNQFENQ